MVRPVEGAGFYLYRVTVDQRSCEYVGPRQEAFFFFFFCFIFFTQRSSFFLRSLGPRSNLLPPVSPRKLLNGPLAFGEPPCHGSSASSWLCRVACSRNCDDHGGDSYYRGPPRYLLSPRGPFLARTADLSPFPVAIPYFLRHGGLMSATGFGALILSRVQGGSGASLLTSTRGNDSGGSLWAEVRHSDRSSCSRRWTPRYPLICHRDDVSFPLTPSIRSPCLNPVRGPRASVHRAPVKTIRQ